jgi:uncharacterized protein YidB (DUF937 family)
MEEAMGLLDEVLGGVLGQQQRGSGAGGGTSPLMIALLGLLATQAFSGKGGGPLGNLGGLLGGAPGGSGGAGGLGGLLERFQQNGFGDVINSWIGTGQNQEISPDELHQALGADTVSRLSQQTGLPANDLLAQLSQLLPGVVDKLTPNGELPSEHEMRSDRLSGPGG